MICGIPILRTRAGRWSRSQCCTEPEPEESWIWQEKRRVPAEQVPKRARERESRLANGGKQLPQPDFGRRFACTDRDWEIAISSGCRAATIPAATISS